MMRLFLLCLCFYTVKSMAQPIETTGVITQNLPTRISTFQHKAFFRPKSITLLKLALSPEAWSSLSAQFNTTLSTQSPVSRHRVALGMNDVPVLDQGPHGTCVTFANTAAISALMGHDNAISQLCQLKLGQTLEKDSYGPSGWNGTTGPRFLYQMQHFGFVTTQTQQDIGCAGDTDYPIHSSSEPIQSLSLAEFHRLSTPFPDNIDWSVVVDPYDIFLDHLSPDVKLNRTKSALDAGDRLTMGVLLFNIHEGVGGAVGRYHTANDSWVLTNDIINAIRQHSADVGGHEMIITGYDDDAIAIDESGQKHRGLLTLRNSWGSDIGDHGDFYMSYDFFKVLAIEIQRIRNLEFGQ